MNLKGDENPGHPPTRRVSATGLRDLRSSLLRCRLTRLLLLQKDLPSSRSCVCSPCFCASLTREAPVTFLTPSRQIENKIEMSSIERQDTSGRLDCYLSGGLLEAPTLSGEEMKHAREQALKILNTKSPEEAFKVFTEGSHQAKAGHLLGEKVEAATMPPNTGNAKPNDAAAAPSPKN